MKDNYFTIPWWFLPYINMNQPQVYMCSPPILNTLPPTSPPWVVQEHWPWVPGFMRRTWTGHLFEEPSCCSPQWLYQFTVPQQCRRVLFSPHSLHLLFVVFFEASCSDRCKGLTTLWFWVAFPWWWSSVLSIFHVPVGHLYVFGKMSIQFFCPFFYQVVCFFDSAIYCSCNKKVEKLGQRVRTWNWWKNYFIFIHHGLALGTHLSHDEFVTVATFSWSSIPPLLLLVKWPWGMVREPGTFVVGWVENCL